SQGNIVEGETGRVYHLKSVDGNAIKEGISLGLIKHAKTGEWINIPKEARYTPGMAYELTGGAIKKDYGWEPGAKGADLENIENYSTLYMKGDADVVEGLKNWQNFKQGWQTNKLEPGEISYDRETRKDWGSGVSEYALPHDQRLVDGKVLTPDVARGKELYNKFRQSDAYMMAKNRDAFKEDQYGEDTFEFVDALQAGTQKYVGKGIKFLGELIDSNDGMKDGPLERYGKSLEETANKDWGYNDAGLRKADAQIEQSYHRFADGDIFGGLKSIASAFVNGGVQYAALSMPEVIGFTVGGVAGKAIGGAAGLYKTGKAAAKLTGAAKKLNDRKQQVAYFMSGALTDGMLRANDVLDQREKITGEKASNTEIGVVLGTQMVMSLINQGGATFIMKGKIPTLIAKNGDELPIAKLGLPDGGKELIKALTNTAGRVVGAAAAEAPQEGLDEFSQIAGAEYGTEHYKDESLLDNAWRNREKLYHASVAGGLASGPMSAPTTVTKLASDVLQIREDSKFKKKVGAQEYYQTDKALKDMTQAELDEEIELRTAEAQLTRDTMNMSGETLADPKQQDSEAVKSYSKERRAIEQGIILESGLVDEVQTLLSTGAPEVLQAIGEVYQNTIDMDGPIIDQMKKQPYLMKQVAEKLGKANKSRSWIASEFKEVDGKVKTKVNVLYKQQFRNLQELHEQKKQAAKY
ncbi:MAG: hypothetical protein U9Q66_03475, partial [Patescibacteria group bacterium]|nr:hypothetical protein [Patescibacteria group bacterium]